MRSSVSVILSGPNIDTNMLRPDYEQTIYHHTSILILVRHLGEEITSIQFLQLFERLSRISHVILKDSAGNERTIWVRYVKDYPVGNNDWGDFQTHRQLLGLITVGKCRTEVEMNEICRIHESLKVKYQNTLYDSRCVIFGVNTESTPQITPPPNFKSTAIYFTSESEHNVELESQMSQFVASLFWILESKRLEKSKEKSEKVSLITAPFEKKDFVGLDMESRSNRKRCSARVVKNLADLSLQAGLPNEALNLYHSALDTLRSVNDWLWIANALEGLCAASIAILYPRSDSANRQPFQRNASLQEKKLRRFSTMSSSSTLSKLVKSQPPPTNILTFEEILRSYKETIIHYSKYQHANVIELEACFKSARIAVKHNAPIQADDSLRHVLNINIALSEEEKIQRLMKLSELYASIGFQRKSSFYRRLTANRFVTASNPQTDWEQCYKLLLETLPGLNLTLDPINHPPDNLNGWPQLQRLVIQDLVVAAKRLGNAGLATRHMTFLMQIMWHHMTPSERHEASVTLQSLTTQCEGSPVPLVLTSGLIIPPANLLNVPYLQNFVVQNLKVHLRPQKLEATKQDYGPFLFTPITFGLLDQKSGKSYAEVKLEFAWVANEQCEVIAEFDNPLPFELEVTSMLLLTSGAVFETIPVSIRLAPHERNHSVALLGIPKETGEIEIAGYSTHTLGVKSNCRLRHMPNIPHNSFSVNVVPALPTLQLTTTLPGDVEIVGIPAALVMYAGEKTECKLLFKNVSSLPIQLMEVGMESLLEPNIQREMIRWDQKSIEDQLPLNAGDVATLTLEIFAVSNFLCQSSRDNTLSAKSSLFSGPGSFPSISSRYTSTTDKPSLLSGESSFNSIGSNSRTIEISSRVLEFHLRVRYSGNPGMEAGYCRVASQIIHAEILNSIAISRWDVLPAETCNQFYLVLDVMNMINQEVELNYSPGKMILMEENESCRIPIPIERCPINSNEELLKIEDNDLNEVAEMNRLNVDHIVSQVDLTWSFGSRKGRASLNGLYFSEEMIDMVRMSPIRWDIFVNSELIETNSTISHTTGDLMRLGIRVRNTLSWNLNDVELRLRFFQDYQNGFINEDLDSCLSSIGAMDVLVKEIIASGSCFHECNVVFFNAGQYKLNVHCRMKEKHTWKLSPPLVIEIREPVDLL